MPVFVIDGEQELVIASGLSIDTKKKRGGGGGGGGGGGRKDV